MNYRYETVSRLTLDDVTNPTDVSVIAGALLFDFMNQHKLIQFKFQNNTDKVLKGLTVKFVVYGKKRDVVLSEMVYRYENIHVAQGACYGEQVPVILKEAQAHCFSCEVVEALYDDVNASVAEGAGSMSLPPLEMLAIDKKKLEAENANEDPIIARAMSQAEDVKHAMNKDLYKKGMLGGLIFIGGSFAAIVLLSML